MFQNITILIIAIFCCASINASTLNDIEEYLKLPSKEIDPIHGLLLVNKIILPNTDIPYYRNRITEIVEEIKAIYGSPRLDHIINYLFNEMEENNYSVLRYPPDYIADNKPSTIEGKHHTLSHIIETKEGVCDARAFLLFAVCREADIPAMIGYAPYHPFVMFPAKEKGKLIHLETGANAYVVDREYFLKRWGLTGYSNKSLFLAPLLNKEVVLTALSSAVENFVEKGDTDKATYLNDLVLKYKPYDFMGLQHRIYILTKQLGKEYNKENPDNKYMNHLLDRIDNLNAVISNNNLYNKTFEEFVEVSDKYDKESNPYIPVN